MGGTAGVWRRSDVIGVAMYLVAAFLFALNGVIAKAALNAGFDPVHLTQLRNAGAMVRARRVHRRSGTASGYG